MVKKLSAALLGSLFQAASVVGSGIMVVSAAALGALTLLIPAEYGWFTIAYAAVGFLFSLAYLTTFLRK